MSKLIYNLDHVAPSLRDTILNSPRLRGLFTKFPEAMLRLDGSTKVIKGNKLGYRTAILYVSPSDISGVNLCAMAKLALCEAPCLNLAGRGVMTINQASRLRKALFWHQYNDRAVALIKHEIALFEARSKRERWTLLVRLNGTSDIRWEQYGIIQSFPSVQFYDYTKLSNRKNIPSNYDLTFSYSGVARFQPYVEQARRNGMRIAAVFRTRAVVADMLERNATFLELPVVDGDDTDIRHLDPHACVVALYAKGKAKQDYSGFVVG